MRFAVIGAGRIGKIHGGNIARRSDCSVAIVADVDASAASALGEATGAKVGSVDEIMAARDIEAVLICSPTDTHADLIERVGQGRQGDLLREADRPLGRARARLPGSGEGAQGRLMIGFNRRFDPNFASAEAQLGGGRDRRGRDRADHLARSRRRRRSPISSARAACSAT